MGCFCGAAVVTMMLRYSPAMLVPFGYGARDRGWRLARRQRASLEHRWTAALACPGPMAGALTVETAGRGATLSHDVAALQAIEAATHQAGEAGRWCLGAAHPY
jgi:hypothetical protein